MNCKCNTLYCDCSSKFKVKLGDFDSAGTIPGLGIKEPTDQMIKFASILPLGTPGYRAPEVSSIVELFTVMFSVFLQRELISSLYFRSPSILSCRDHMKRYTPQQ